VYDSYNNNNNTVSVPQVAVESDSESDDEDIYSDVYEILSSMNNKVMLMPDNHQLTPASAPHSESASTGPGKQSYFITNTKTSITSRPRAVTLSWRK